MLEAHLLIQKKKPQTVLINVDCIFEGATTIAAIFIGRGLRGGFGCFERAEEIGVAKLRWCHQRLGSRHAMSFTRRGFFMEKKNVFLAR